MNMPQMPSSIETVTGETWPGVNYFTTTRSGGVSGAGYASFNLGLHTQDEPEHVFANRHRLRSLLPADPFWLQQVHGVDVVDADRAALADTQDPIVADAAITMEPDRVLAIMTADCLPVVVASTDGRALGVAHAGWRGLQAGILEAMVDALHVKHPDARGWHAWIGPGISQDFFEVGTDVYSAFVNQNHPAAADARDYFRAATNPGKWMADLPGLANRRLQLAGVDAVNLSGYCTAGQNEKFYSYRLDASTGRLATLAWLDRCQ
jgi:YfiH family protein